MGLLNRMGHPGMTRGSPDLFDTRMGPISGAEGNYLSEGGGPEKGPAGPPENPMLAALRGQQQKKPPGMGGPSPLVEALGSGGAGDAIMGGAGIGAF